MSESSCFHCGQCGIHACMGQIKNLKNEITKLKASIAKKDWQIKELRRIQDEDKLAYDLLKQSK